MEPHIWFLMYYVIQIVNVTAAINMSFLCLDKKEWDEDIMDWMEVVPIWQLIYIRTEPLSQLRRYMTFEEEMLGWFIGFSTSHELHINTMPQSLFHNWLFIGFCPPNEKRSQRRDLSVPDFSLKHFAW